MMRMTRKNQQQGETTERPHPVVIPGRLREVTAQRAAALRAVLGGKTTHRVQVIQAPVLPAPEVTAEAQVHPR